jgi:hypothetical protein
MKHLLILVLGIICMSSKIYAQVSEAEAQSFAQKLDKEFEQSNYAIISQNFSIREFCKRLGEIGQEKSFRDGFGETFNLGANIEKEVGVVGSYRLLRVRKKDGEFCPLFRLINAAGGINYHDYKLTKIDGEIAIVDLFAATTDEYLSETLSDVINKMSPKNNGNAKLAAHFAKLNRLRGNEDHKGIVKYISKLPEDLANNKAIQAINLKAASNLDDEKLYLKLLENYKKTNASQEHISLLMMDAHVIRKEYKQGLNLIDELDKSVGGDPQLDFQRFLYHKLDGDTVTAIKFLQKAAANYPNDNFIQLEMVAMTFGEREVKKEAYELMLKSYRDNKLLNQDLLKQYLTSIGENPEPPAKAYKSPTKK